MRLSLVTPSLNQLGYLRQCVDNVRQLGPGIEHIVADGASSDGSVAFLEQAHAAEGDRLRFRVAADRGMYDALGNGFALASGEVLGYLNCDDRLLPWASEAVGTAFRMRPEVDIVYADALEWRPASDSCALVIHPPPLLLRRFLERGGHLAQPAVFFRRRLLERLAGFDARYRLLGDHDFWLRALRENVICAKLWEVIAIQRVVPGQLMQRHAAEVETERAAIHQRLGIVPPTHEDRRYVRRLYAICHRLAIASLALQLSGARALPGGLPLPWQRIARARYLQSAEVGALRRALLGSTRGRRYLAPTPAGRLAFGLEPEAVAP